MKWRRLLLITAPIAIAIVTVLNLTVISQKTPEKPVYVTQTVNLTIPLNADTIFDLVNAERVKAGVPPLVRDPILDATAKERVDDMVARNYYSHYDPIDGHKMIDDQNAGCVQSENQNLVTVSGNRNTIAVNSWLGSKSHHDALLLAEYTHTGVAVNGDKVVQHFCTR